MRKLIPVCLFFAMVTLGVQTQDPLDLARQFLESLRQEKFAEAVKVFNPQMTAALPPEQLAQAWATVRAQAGDFKSELSEQSSTGRGGVTTVILGLQFERAAINMVVSVGTAKRIAGLNFVPRPAEPLTAALPAGLTEEPFTVGSGTFALPGTLTLPLGTAKGPAVVLVHGSGPGDRDETLGPNKPLRDLAWGLASRGIAVLRYEKRTRQHATAIARIPNFTVREETVEDAVLAVQALRLHARIDVAKVFVAGHSLGGMLAPRIGQEDKTIGGLILLAGNTRSIQEGIVEQSEYLASVDPNPAAQASIAILRAQVARTQDPAVPLNTPPNQLLNAPVSYWKDLNAYKPASVAASLTMPMLILQGERDYQVTMKDFEGWKEALKARTNVTFKSYPDLNHLFITGIGKSTPAEYEKPGRVSETVIEDVATWVKAR